MPHPLRQIVRPFVDRDALPQGLVRRLPVLVLHVGRDEREVVLFVRLQAAFLHGQVLKYMLRLWHKDNAVQDAKKSRWYLDRLIEALDY